MCSYVVYVQWWRNEYVLSSLYDIGYKLSTLYVVRAVVGSGGAGRAVQSPRHGSRSTGDPAAPSASADGSTPAGRQRSSWEARAGLLLKQRA